MHHPRILIISLTWPEPSTTAAGERMMQLISCFRERDYPVTYASTALKTAFAEDLSILGIQEALIVLNHHSFDDFIKKLDPGIVLFDRFTAEEQFGWRVAKYAPTALRVLDTEDLHSLRDARRKAFSNNSGFELADWVRNDMTKREIASIYRSDLSLIISPFEMDLLTDGLNIDTSLLMYLPFMVDLPDPETIQTGLPFEDRKHFVFVGNGKHVPNTDAIGWLSRGIWPVIRKKLPGAELHVYGAYLPESTLEFHDPETGFIIHGWVEDIQEVLRCSRVNLVPLRFGAGLKGKIISAIACGTPSVTTSIGAEGIEQPPPWSITPSDKAQPFADAAIRLYMDGAYWRSVQSKGLQMLHKGYDSTELKKQLTARILSLEEGLSAHRLKNFIGSMLLHDTLGSTRYMAKWIEAKNAPPGTAGVTPERK